MEIYTVSFFGHREVEGAAEIESRLERLLHDLITQKEYVEFLFVHLHLIKIERNLILPIIQEKVGVLS